MAKKDSPVVLSWSEGGRSLKLIRGGPRAYLWVGTSPEDAYLASFGGENRLRGLALAILAQLDKPRQTRKRAKV